MKTKTINQTITFDASPKDVYQALLDDKKHAEFTKSAATIDNDKNGKFSVYDGYCHGYNIELTVNEKIVQAWHFAEEGWPDDHYSICTFLIKQSGTRTNLTFTQTDIPKHKADALNSGWIEYYWEPMHEYFKH